MDVGEIVVAKDADHPAAADLQIAASTDGAEPSTAAIVDPGVGLHVGVEAGDVLVPHAVAAAAFQIAAGPARHWHRRRFHYGGPQIRRQGWRGHSHHSRNTKKNSLHGIPRLNQSVTFIPQKRHWRCYRSDTEDNYRQVSEDR
jgi:hypothetical protein